MALTNTDFIAPKGELTEDMFPGVTLADHVDAWIADAEGRASDEEAQWHWVMHRAYRTVANRLMLEWMRERRGNREAGRNDLQNRYYLGRADDHLSQFRARTSAGGGAVVAPIGFRS